MTQPDKTLDWPIAWPAVEEIARSEGCRLKAYRCPAGQWTIGWGHADGVRPGDTVTQAQADDMLRTDLMLFAESVRGSLTRDPSDNEFGAMVSLAYNVGREGFRKSTVLRKHNAGDTQAAAAAFALWNKAGGRVLPGLVARRAREAAMYLTPDDDGALPMPQAVDKEKALATSRTIAGGVVAVAGAAIGIITPEDVQVISTAAEALGWTAFSAALPHVASLIGVAYMLYARFDDRAKGLR